MSSLLWRRRRRVRPATVPTDTVIPLHYFDDHPFIRPIVLYFMMRFDDVLDAEALRKPLEKLLSLDGWRKLGARIRANEQGKLEYHVPAEYNDDRPAIAYHHEPFDIRVKEHPVASKLPAAAAAAAGDVAQVLGKAEDFLSLMRQDGDPTTLDDYLYSDLPLLGLRVVSFNDATLVTFSWSHVVLDGMGRKALLDAWSLVLNGREGEVLPFHGFADDPLATFGTNPREEYKHADKQLSTWQILMLAARSICFNLWSPPSTDESRVVMVPASYAQHLRNTARADLSSDPTPTQQPAAVDGGGNQSQNQPEGSSRPFVSEGDVICAWWARRIIAAQLPATSTRTIAINLPFGIRWLLSEDLLPSRSAYVANAVLSVPTFLSAKDLLAKPFGQVANLIRSALQTLGTRDQMEAHAALARSAMSRGSILLLGDAWMQTVVCTNWSKGKFYQVDFSGAVLKDGARSNGQAAGRPSYIQAHAFAEGISFSNCFSIVGKDALGNTWLTGVLRRQYWPAVEEALANGVV